MNFPLCLFSEQLQQVYRLILSLRLEQSCERHAVHIVVVVRNVSAEAAQSLVTFHQKLFSKRLLLFSTIDAFIFTLMSLTL